MRARTFWFVGVPLALLVTSGVITLVTKVDGATLQLLSGHATLNGSAAPAGMTLGPGDQFETAVRGNARLQAAGASITVGTETQFRVDAVEPGRLALALDRGMLDVTSTGQRVEVDVAGALVGANDGAWQVERLAAGPSRVVVTRGVVTLAGRGRDILVPPGALSIVYPDLGPGAPRVEGASDAFLEAVEAVETLPTTAIRRVVGAEVVIHEARAADAVTLVGLLARVEERERQRFVDRLIELRPPPPEIDTTAAARGTPAAITAWQRHLIEGHD